MRRARFEAARRNNRWTELDEGALVPRQRRLVDADSDAVFAPYRGVLFARSSASVTFNESIAMHYYVDREGDVRFLEKMRFTWSEYYGKLQRRSVA